MLKITTNLIIVFTILMFSGCSVSNVYNHPKKSEPYALIKIADDEKHIAGMGMFRHLSLRVYKINNKNSNSFLEVKQLKVNPGKIELLIIEDNRKLPRVYKGKLEFNAQANGKYLLTSKHILKHGIVDVVFMILDSNNNVVTYD